MFNIRNKFNTNNDKQKNIVYWDKDICGFEPKQNKEGTLLPYTKEQVSEMLSQGTIVASEEGRPVVVPRPEPTEEEKQAQYKKRVSQLIRQKYSADDELAIIRQQSTNSGEYDEYFAYCEACKARAKAEFQ